jgi:transcriptional regulator with XRE-family HTH domain
MNVGVVLRQLRQRSALSLRDLGAAAHTSHSTLAAYEAGRVDPTAHTVQRVAAAAGFELEVAAVRRVAEHGTRERELLDVLALAAEFPARHHRTLRAPVFGR